MSNIPISKSAIEAFMFTVFPGLFVIKTQAMNHFSMACWGGKYLGPSDPNTLSSGLNENSSHRFTYLNACLAVCGTLWEDQEVWPCWRRGIIGGKMWGFKSPGHFLSLPSPHPLVIVISTCKPSVTILAPCLPACYPASHHDNYEVFFMKLLASPKLSVFLYKLHWLWCFIFMVLVMAIEK